MMLDDVAVARLELSRVANLGSGCQVEIPNCAGRDGLVSVSFVNALKSVSIAANLFFILVPERRLPEQNSLEPSLVYRNALDPVRRDGALEDRVVPQNLESLRRLSPEEFLLPSRLLQIRQIPCDRGRSIALTTFESSERMHCACCHTPEPGVGTEPTLPKTGDSMSTAQSMARSRRA